MRGDDIQQAITDWVNQESISVPPAWESASAPRPPRPYISLMISSIVPTGQDEDFSLEELPSGKGLQIRRNTYNMILTLTYNGQESSQNINGLELLTKLRLSFAKESVKKIFRDAGLGFMHEISLNILPVQLATSYEERVTMDLSFLVVMADEEEIDLIKHVEMPGDYLNQTGQIERQQTAIVEDT